jgi:hypothetical protein
MAEVQGLQLDAAPLQGHGWGHVASLGVAHRPDHWFSPARQIHRLTSAQPGSRGDPRDKYAGWESSYLA